MSKKRPPSAPGPRLRRPESTPTAAPAPARQWLVFAGLAAVGFFTALAATSLVARGSAPAATANDGMVWVPPGEFVMGSTSSADPANERPAHRVRLDGFWMDDHEVTNAEFRRFVAATGYVTTAEQKPEWEELKKSLPPDTPRPDDSKLVPGAVVFTPPEAAVPLDNVGRWWRWVPGASWQYPEGPKSDLTGRANHPVVQVSWDDAVAYARWAGKRLPTEAEWEYAARGGLAGKRFVWGDEAPTETSPLANIWQGDFPWRNTKADGYDRTAPVKSYAPNGYGLHDMAGNVWEWCDDRYRADAYRKFADVEVAVNPQGPSDSWDPNEPWAAKRVTRGGSFLCHVSYCESYRTAARRGTAPDNGMSHLGFRCVRAGGGS